ncbi:MAG: 3-methyl-2-oxobutanoate hydroxymethyltransferase [Gemmataceae bacterium]
MSITRKHGLGDQTNNRPASKPVTVLDFLAVKSSGKKLTMLTAYDYTMARLLDAAGVDCLLVGDSLSMVMQGNSTSIPVTLDEMIYHTRLVCRGTQRACVVGDLPFLSYQVSPEKAVENAGRLLKEGGAHAVKLEGGVRVQKALRAITDADIPVMGHIGMTPQSVHALGGFRVQRNGQKIIDDAKAVEESGAFAIVVECVPEEIAEEITATLKIPTIGIGAGAKCDGQVLVIHDMLGMFPDFTPKFVKQYENLGEQISAAVKRFCQEVQESTFPAAEHTYK